MTQSEKLLFLIQSLLDENPQYRNMEIPTDPAKRFQLFRSLVNIRQPQTIGEAFLTVQDEFLQTEISVKGITDISDLSPIEDNIFLWQGDITMLKCDAIINAANSGMTGCYCPCHACIDNAIHTFAGVQLRLECAEIMQKQGFSEPTGHAKITKAYNLPCKYVIHTVGPIVNGRLTKAHEKQLADCYLSCLETATKHNLKSIAFCCISTGEFHFPNDRAAEIAVDTVRKFSRHQKEIKVIFNVFKDSDDKHYRKLLG